jgi:hypothetical protein
LRIVRPFATARRAVCLTPDKIDLRSGDSAALLKGKAAGQPETLL